MPMLFRRKNLPANTLKTSIAQILKRRICFAQLIGLIVPLASRTYKYIVGVTACAHIPFSFYRLLPSVDNVKSDLSFP